jgi:hypothetical protein
MPYIETLRNMLTPFGGIGSQLAGSTGGTITTSGGYRIHTFTTVGSSTFTPSGSGTVEYLIVAGGGGGSTWYAGGGGAGGLLSGSTSVTATNYTITVGDKGNGRVPPEANVDVAYTNSSTPSSYGQKGGDSVAFSLTANGGGGAPGYNCSNPGRTDIKNGGSGAGGRPQAYSPEGTGVAGQGFAGGAGSTGENGGGGGGAGSAGIAGSLGGGGGGTGVASSISGTSTFYSGGGAGGVSAGYPATGGSGIGGTGTFDIQGGDATGYGAGGGSNSNNYTVRGGHGSQGIVVVRYAI